MLKKNKCWLTFIFAMACFIRFCSGKKVVNPLKSVFADLDDLPFKMSMISSPHFPDLVFNIKDFGVKEGQNISNGAKVFFSTDKTDYLPVVFTRWEGIECYNYSPLIYVNGCKNIAITDALLKKDRETLKKRTTKKQMFREIRRLTHIRRLYELLDPGIEYLGKFACYGLMIKKMIFHLGEGIVLPALFYVPERLSGYAPVIYLYEQGKSTGQTGFIVQNRSSINR